MAGDIYGRDSDPAEYSYIAVILPYREWLVSWLNMQEVHEYGQFIAHLSPGKAVDIEMRDEFSPRCDAHNYSVDNAFKDRWPEHKGRKIRLELSLTLTSDGYKLDPVDAYRAVQKMLDAAMEAQS